MQSNVHYRRCHFFFFFIFKVPSMGLAKRSESMTTSQQQLVMS